MGGEPPRPWRFRCPFGHASWKARHRRGDYYCERCGSHFDRLIDVKTEEPAVPTPRPDESETR